MKIINLLLVAFFIQSALATAGTCAVTTDTSTIIASLTLTHDSDPPALVKYQDFVSCLAEHTSVVMTQITINTGELTAEGTETSDLDLLGRFSTTPSTNTFIIDATGSNFSAAQYDRIVDAIVTAKADIKDAKITFDGADLTQTTIDLLVANEGKITDDSTVMAGGLEVLLTATAFTCANVDPTATVVVVGPHDKLTGGDLPASLNDVIDCYEEKATSSQTSITIVTGSLSAAESTDTFDFSASTASSGLSITIDATGSSFTTAQYDSIVESIYAAKAKLSAVTLKFDGANISQSSIAKLQDMASTVNDTSVVMIGGSSVTLTDVNLLAAVTITYTSDSAFLCTDYNYYKILDLTAKVPADEAAMDTCLGIINDATTFVTTLKISYAGLDLSGGVPAFATLLDNVITQLTVLEIDASGTNLNVLPVLTGFTSLNSLVLNLTGNQVSDTQTVTLITALSTLYSISTGAAIATANITTKLQGAATDLTKTVLPLNLDTIAAFTTDTKTVEVWDFDNTAAAVCSIGDANLNTDGCQFKPKLYIAEKTGTTTNICATKTVDLELVPYNMNGVTATYTATWTLDPVPTSYSAIDTTADSDFSYDATNFVADTEYTVTVGLASPTPATLVLKESFNLTLRPCAPTVSLNINAAAVVSSYDCSAALVFTVNDASILDTDGTTPMDADTLTNSTTYLWAYKNADKSADIASAGAKNTNTFTIAVSELISADFVITLVIGTPEIIVEDLELTVSGCAATAFINGAALVANSSYTNCQDLVLSVGNEVTAGIVDGTTTYAWKLETGSADVLATHDPVIDNTTAAITYAKGDLVVGSYTIGLDLSLPDVDITDFDIAITDGGTCGAEDSAPADVEAFILHFAASFFLLLLLT